MITRQDLVNLLLDFIQVWIHQILYVRELYPTAIFELKKKYNVPVHMAAHEQVARYISQFVESLQPLVLKGNCKCVALKIISPTNHLLERFVLEIESALWALDVPLESVLDSEPTCSLADMQQELRACFLRMAATRSSLSKNPPDCTFSLTVETFTGPPAQGVETGDWIPAENSNEQRWSHLIPLKTIPMDLFKINVFVMEAVKKGKHISR
ncbi:DNA-binding protein [Fennellomyces sp. T-0311]|nr:DNA-binding protein [Fennellomyces sp. T-0311]